MGSPAIVSLKILLTLFLLGCSGCFSNGATGWSSSWGGSSGHKEVVDVLALEGLGEKTWPVSLNLVAGGLDALGQFFFLYAVLDT